MWNLIRTFFEGNRKSPKRQDPRRRPPRRFEILETRWMPATNVLVYHNDLQSTGVNPNETVLTPSNVNVNTFGKLFTTPLDGQVYAQPLVVTGVNVVGQGVHDVVIVATEHDSVYALDAASGAILWQRSFIDPANGLTTVPAPDDLNNGDIAPEVGITSTPAIDPTTNTIYVVDKAKQVVNGQNHYLQYLQAIDLRSGASVLGGPKMIADTIYNATTGAYTYVSGPTVNGTGDGSVGGQVTYNALRENQRSALSLINGTVYIASASHGDNGPYHGWLLGYSAQTLALTTAFNTTPNGGLGGTWEAGGGVTVDSQGFLYIVTGNGTFDTQLDANGFPIHGDYGMSVLKLALDPNSSPTQQNINGWGLKVVDYFTPFNYADLDAADQDLGSSGVVILPDSVGSVAHPHLAVISGKEGRMYLLDRDNLGKFNPVADQVVQTVPGQLQPTYDTPAYFAGTLYFVGNEDNGKTFSISNGQISPSPTSLSSDRFAYPGSTPSISSNGLTNGIVWTVNKSPGELRAYAAGSFNTKLYTSSQAPNNRDQLGASIKFEVPTIANGRIYVGLANGLVAYGLLSPPPPALPAVPTKLLVTPLAASLASLTWTNSGTNQQGFLIEESTDGVNFTQVAITPSTSYVVGGLSASTQYTFRVRAYNSVGDSDYSNPASVVTTSGAGESLLDFSNGFGGSAVPLVVNGSAGLVGGNAQLTNSTLQTGSVFSTNKFSVSKFSTTFTFQLLNGTNPSGDGFTFTIESGQNTALGAQGSGLGYGANAPGGTGGISNSVAVKFDLYNNNGEGFDSTGLYINGASPTVANSIALDTTGIDLHSTHVFAASLVYNGTTLQETILDTQTGVKVTESYTVNIPSIVGGSTAYVGFTGGTGMASAIQNVATWYYLPTAAAIPLAPASPTAAPASATTISLSWQNRANNGATGIIIERQDGANAPFVVLPITLSATATSFVDQNLVIGVVYSYRMRTTNTAGVSLYSDLTTATIPPPPPTPSGAHATITATSVTLAWTDNASNEQGYRIFRKVGSGGTFNLLVSLPANTTSYLDSGLTPGTEYDYHIQAYNVAGFSDFTGYAALTIPAAPTGLSAIAAGDQITLSWAPTLGAATYNVYRSTSSNGEGATPLASGITGTTFTNVGLASNTTYYYQVAAVNTPQPGQVGVSGKSSEFSIATLFGTKINFSDSNLQVPTGYINDIGLAFGPNAPGLTFGWNQDNTINARNRNSSLSPDERYDSFNHMQRPSDPNAFWEIAVPNGTYRVTLASGDASNIDSVYKINVEGVLAINGTPTAATHWFTSTVVVTVTDGRLTVSNAAGAVNNRIDFIDITELTSAKLDFSNGFAGATALMTLNGSAALSGANLQLTDGGSTEKSSAFSTQRYDVTTFTSQFNFQILDGTTPSADGFAFVIQGVGPTALGSPGAGLGYGPPSSTTAGNSIAKSIAIKFDLWSNEGEGFSSTGLYINGAAPTAANSISLSNAGLDLHSGHPFRANLSYNGTTLTVVITDTVTNVSATQNYTVNIPSLIGGNTGYIGFTAGTGFYTAVQKITNWTYIPLAASAPTAPQSLTATAGNAQVQLAWATVTGATSYVVYRSTSSTTFSTTPYATVAAGTTFTDTAVVNGTTYYYRVAAVNKPQTGVTGTSAPSYVVSAIPTAPLAAAVKTAAAKKK
jgi:fibronectin type 3 domain-containing protein